MMILNLTEKMSVRKALLHIGASRCKLYYNKVGKKQSETPLDSTVKSVVKKIAFERLAYGTRRLDAAAARDLQNPVNCKQVQ